MQAALDACVEPLLQIRNIIRENLELDDAQVRLRFNGVDRRPTVNVRVVAALRAAMDSGQL